VEINVLRQPENQFISLISPQYVKALLAFHEKMNGNPAQWALSGDLGEALRTVRVDPDCIEVVTDKTGAYMIHKAVEALKPTPVTYQTRQHPRNALVQGVEYPVSLRSHYFEFSIEGLPVKVHGDLQFRVGNWEWGDKFQFTPDVVYVVNRKTSIVPLDIKYELYMNLGWLDRAENIRKVFALRQRVLNQAVR
jgi:hypothetical protein